MAITDSEVIQNYIRMCGDGWDQGWHERNGGNLTYRMRPEEVEQCRPYFKAIPGQWVNMGVQADNLRGEFFISTGSGKYFRNVPLAPQDNICIVEINAAGDAWRIVWGLEKGGRPTSEFPSHFLNHSVRKEATGGACRVIYHAHPANLIAMTYILPLTARDFTRALWKRGALDGPRRQRHRPGHQPADEGVRRGGVGPPRAVRLRPGLRHHLRPDAHHREGGSDLSPGPFRRPGAHSPNHRG